MTAQLSEVEIAGLVDRVVRLVRPERVVLFGSYAKGHATSGSDLDLLVVTSPDERAWRASDLRPFVSGSIVPIDVHFATTEELEVYGSVPHHFLHSVLRSGRTVYTRAPGPVDLR